MSWPTYLPTLPILFCVFLSFCPLFSGVLFRREFHPRRMHGPAIPLQCLASCSRKKAYPVFLCWACASYVCILVHLGPRW